MADNNISLEDIIKEFNSNSTSSTTQRSFKNDEDVKRYVPGQKTSRQNQSNETPLRPIEISRDRNPSFDELANKQRAAKMYEKSVHGAPATNATVETKTVKTTSKEHKAKKWIAIAILASTIGIGFVGHKAGDKIDEFHQNRLASQVTAEYTEAVEEKLKPYIQETSSKDGIIVDYDGVRDALESDDGRITAEEINAGKAIMGEANMNGVINISSNADYTSYEELARKNGCVDEHGAVDPKRLDQKLGLKAIAESELKDMLPGEYQENSDIRKVVDHVMGK